MSVRLTAIATLLLAPLSAQAADPPKQGTDSYTTTYVTTSFNTMKLGDRTVTNYDTSGITRNDSGGLMFNNMSARCLGTREAIGSQVSNRGSCIIGGTGKYSGISGTAEYTGQPIKSSDDRGMTVVAHKATWKLPSS